MTINIGFDVKPLEAINYFKAKGLKATFSYADMLAADHVNNFTIAKMMDIDLLQDMYDSLLQAQKKGWTLQQWKERMIPHLQANGWWGRQAVVDPVTGKTILSELGSSRRLDIIFRTNMQMAYAAGHWQQIKEQERIAPYLMYNAVDDYRTREEHRANDNKIYPISHPFWVTHYPPNGFNCRCTTIQLSKSDLEDFGYEVSPDTEIKYKNWKNPRTGLIEKIPVGTDAGFNFNAGQARYEQLQQLAKEKAQAIKDKALKQAALDALDEMQNPLKADAAKGGIMSTQATINQQIVMPTLKQLNTPDVLKISEREALEQWASPNEIQKIEGYLLNDTDIAKNAKAYGLTIEEQIAIYYYTGYGSDLLNMMLNGESAFSVHIARVAILLNQALDKLPNHQGIVIRRERPKPLIMDTHFVGAVVTYHGFTSTTYGVEDVFPERKVRLVIHSKTGKNIHWLSLSKEFEDLAEYEVLLSQPKHFLVIDRYEVNDYIEIVLREIE